MPASPANLYANMKHEGSKAMQPRPQNSLSVPETAADDLFHTPAQEPRDATADHGNDHQPPMVALTEGLETPIGATGRQPLDEQLSEEDSELRNPASPGCVYSGLQLELSPGDAEDDCATTSHLNADAVELRDIARASKQLQDINKEHVNVTEGLHVNISEALEPVSEERGLGEGVGAVIQSLPPASQVDPSVLDALPLQMKRKIERAYGESFWLRSLVAWLLMRDPYLLYYPASSIKKAPFLVVKILRMEHCQQEYSVVPLPKR